MVEQIRRLGIPHQDWLTAVNNTKVKSPYGLSVPNHCVDYAIIGQCK
jgi:hypothetical protein